MNEFDEVAQSLIDDAEEKGVILRQWSKSCSGLENYNDEEYAVFRNSYSLLAVLRVEEGGGFTILDEEDFPEELLEEMEAA